MNNQKEESSILPPGVSFPPEDKNIEKPEPTNLPKEEKVKEDVKQVLPEPPTPPENQEVKQEKAAHAKAQKVDDNTTKAHKEKEAELRKREKLLEEQETRFEQKKKQNEIVNSKAFEDFTKKTDILTITRDKESTETLLSYTLFVAAKEGVNNGFAEVLKKWKGEISKDIFTKTVAKLYHKKMFFIMIGLSLLLNIFLAYLISDFSEVFEKEGRKQSFFQKDINVFEANDKYFLRLKQENQIKKESKSQKLWLERKSYYVDKQGNVYIYIGKK